MTELDKILITSSLTIGGGVIVYVLGQVISKFIIEPTHEMYKVIGSVRYNLAYHAATINTPTSRTQDKSDRAFEDILKNSCELIEKANSIPFYKVISVISMGKLPCKANVKLAAKRLRGLSTYVHEIGDEAVSNVREISQRIESIEKLLNLEPLE
ncbi:MAG: hypothetical protein ACU88J_07930 [Gammaproteobacteria bacterium]